MAINKNKQAAIDELKKQWRSGARWCAFKGAERICTKEIKCFRAYSQAAKYCEAENKKIKYSCYRIMVITDLLKRFSYSVKNKQQKQAGISKIFLCEKYPPLSFPASIDHLTILSMDKYFPVIWNKIINPILAISEWLVISESRPDSIMFKSEIYVSALNYFMQQTDRISKTGIKDELKLQAKLCAESTSKYFDLYNFYYHTRRGVYVLDKKMDEINPFLLKITCFAKYNQRLKRLDFFDESLKKTVAGKINEEMDVAYYDVE